MVHWGLHILGASGDFTFSVSGGIGQVFTALAAALTGVLVLAPRFGRRNRWLGLLAAAVIMVLAGTLSALAYNFGGNGIGRTGWMPLIFYLIVSGALVAGTALAFLRSRIRRIRPGFAVGLLVWAFVLTILAVLVYGLYDSRPRDADDLIEILTVGLLFAACTCGVTLPFLILVHASEFFSRRFETWSGVESSSQAGGSELVG